MKTNLFIFSLVVLSSFNSMNSVAQQEYQFANTSANPFLLNPAAGGMTDVMQFEASSRMQWVGYDGGPRTIMLSGHSQFGSNSNGHTLGEFNVKDEAFFQGPKVSIAKRKHVIGGKVWNDAIGPFSKTSVQGSYAYHLPLTKKLNFGVGIGLGYSNFRLNESKVVLHQEDDNAYAQFLGNSSQQSLGDAQAGLVIYGEKFFFGASSTQILKNKVELNQVMTGSNFNRHYFFITKYSFEVSSTLDIEPLAVLKIAESSPLSLDFGARFVFNKNSWATIQYRANNALVFQLGGNLIKNLYLNYAFEYGIGKIRSAGTSTHEIQLGYYLGKNRNVDKELKNNAEADGL